MTLLPQPDRSLALNAQGRLFETDAIQFLGSLVARLELGCDVLAASRCVSARGPDRQVGLWDQNTTPVANEGDRSFSGGLTDGFRAPTQSSRRDRCRNQGFSWNHLGDGKSSPGKCHQSADFECIFGLGTLKSEMRQGRLENSAGRGRLHLPGPQRPASAGTGSLLVAGAIEDLAEEADGLMLHLLDDDTGLIHRLAGALEPHGVGAACDPDTAIRVQHARQVRSFEIGRFSHALERTSC